MLLRQFRQLLHQPVKLLVGNLRLSKDIIKVVMPIQLLPEPGNAMCGGFTHGDRIIPRTSVVSC
jgi:hypothetical protein